MILAQFISLFSTGKNRLSIVQITDQFKFFILRSLSRKDEEKKFVLTNNIFFVTSIQFVACTFRENLSSRTSGVQIPRDICTRFGRYLYSMSAVGYNTLNDLKRICIGSRRLKSRLLKYMT